MTQLALRLASFRDPLKKDLDGTLAKIVEAGFGAVEVTEMLGDTNETYAQALADAGLHVVSFQTQLHHLRARFTENIKTDQLLNSEFLVVPIVQLDEYGSGWERLGAELGRIAGLVSENGPRLAYQPNKADFRPDRGARGFDFLEEAAGNALDYELDLKVLMDAQVEPSELLGRLGKQAAIIVLDVADREPNDADAIVQQWRRLGENRGGWAVLAEMPGNGERFEKLALWRELIEAA